MSKAMGQSLMTALMPTTQHAWGQMMKAGGGGVEGFAKSIGKMSNNWGGLGGFKNYFSGKKMGTAGWQQGGKNMLQTRTARRGAFGYAGAMIGMNAMVGDEGFMGFTKGTVNNASTLAIGSMAYPGIRRWANAKGGFRGGATKAAFWGGAAAWGASKVGLI